MGAPGKHVHRCTVFANRWRRVTTFARPDLRSAHPRRHPRTPFSGGHLQMVWVERRFKGQFLSYVARICASRACRIEYPIRRQALTPTYLYMFKYIYIYIVNIFIGCSFNIFYSVYYFVYMCMICFHTYIVFFLIHIIKDDRVS